MWLKVLNTKTGDMHVYPEDEEHYAFACWCEPEYRIIEDAVLTIHNSGDGREALEQAEKILARDRNP